MGFYMMTFMTVVIAGSHDKKGEWIRFLSVRRALQLQMIPCYHWLIPLGIRANDIKMHNYVLLTV